MNRIIAIAFLCFLLLPMTAGAQNTNTNTINVTYTFTDFNLTPQAVRRATQTPLKPNADFNGAILSASPVSKVTSGAGSVSFSNTASGYAYRIQLDTPYGSTVRTCSFPSSLSGNVNGRDYLGSFNGQDFYYLYPNNTTLLISNALNSVGFNAANFIASANGSGTGLLTLSNSGPQIQIQNGANTATVNVDSNGVMNSSATVNAPTVQANTVNSTYSTSLSYVGAFLGNGAGLTNLQVPVGNAIATNAMGNNNGNGTNSTLWQLTTLPLGSQLYGPTAPMTISNGTFTGPITAPSLTAGNVIWTTASGPIAASSVFPQVVTNLSAPTFKGISSVGSGSQSEQYGAGAQATAQFSTAVGPQAVANGTQTVSIGVQAGNGVGAVNSVTIGPFATNNFPGSVAIGVGATSTGANQVRFGPSMTVYAPQFNGGGAALTGLTAANLTGDVPQTSLTNGLNGALLAGANMTITPSGNGFLFASSGGGGTGGQATNAIGNQGGKGTNTTLYLSTVINDTISGTATGTLPNLSAGNVTLGTLTNRSYGSNIVGVVSNATIAATATNAQIAALATNAVTATNLAAGSTIAAATQISGNIPAANISNALVASVLPGVNVQFGNVNNVLTINAAGGSNVVLMPIGMTDLVTSAGTYIYSNPVTGKYNSTDTNLNTISSGNLTVGGSIVGTAINLTNVLADALVVYATNFGVTAYPAKNASDLANVQALATSDLAFSNCFKFCTNYPGKVKVMLPFGVSVISNGPLYVPSPNIQLVGQGIMHKAGWGQDTYFTNYSAIWQRNNNCGGLVLFATDVGAYDLQDFEIIGNSSPLDTLTSTNFQGASFWSPKTGVTNATQFATIGLHVRGQTTPFCGGINARRVAISGFRVGLLNEGNDEVWQQCQFQACDVGWINTGVYIASNLNSTAYPAMPININAYVGLMETNSRGSFGYTAFNASTPNYGWNMGVPDQITMIGPSFGYRVHGVGLYSSRNNGVTIIGSAGANGPSTYAFLTDFNNELNVIGGNDEPNGLIGTNWIYFAGNASGQNGSVLIDAKNWRVSGGPLGGTTNAYGDDLRACSFLYVDGQAAVNKAHLDVNYANNVTTNTLWVDQVGGTQGGGDIQSAYPGYVMIGSSTYPIYGKAFGTPGGYQMADGEIFWITNNFYGNPNSQPFGKPMVMKGYAHGKLKDYFWAILGTNGANGPELPSGHFMTRFLTSDPATPWDLVNSPTLELPNNYTVDKISGGAMGLTNAFGVLSNDICQLTPEMFGAKGDLSADDTAAVQACESTTEALIAQGKPYQALYRGTYRITGSLKITNRFNILGRTRPAGVFIQTPKWAPTFVSTSPTNIINAFISATCFSGSVIDGVTTYSSNYWYNSGAFAGPGSSGITLSATGANGNFLDIVIKNFQAVGTDWAVLTTNVDDLVIYNLWGQTTNGVAVGSATGASSNPQACHLERIQGAYSGTGIYCSNAYMAVISPDISLNSAVSKCCIRADNGSRLVVANPNFEMTSNPGSDTTNLMLVANNSTIDVLDGSMSLGNNRPSGYTTNGGCIHWRNTQLSTDSAGVAIVSDNATADLSTWEGNPIQSLLTTNRPGGSTSQLNQMYAQFMWVNSQITTPGEFVISTAANGSTNFGFGSSLYNVIGTDISQVMGPHWGGAAKNNLFLLFNDTNDKNEVRVGINNNTSPLGNTPREPVAYLDVQGAWGGAAATHNISLLANFTNASKSIALQVTTNATLISDGGWMMNSNAYVAPAPGQTYLWNSNNTGFFGVRNIGGTLTTNRMF